jgi:hypothetical protein
MMDRSSCRCSANLHIAAWEVSTGSSIAQAACDSTSEGKLYAGNTAIQATYNLVRPNWLTTATMTGWLLAVGDKQRGLQDPVHL